MPVGTSAAEIYSKLRLHISLVGTSQACLLVRPQQKSILTYVCMFRGLARVRKFKRTKQEVEEYQKHRDPILQLGARLVDAGYATEDELKMWDKEAKQLAKDAEAFADASDNPPIEEAYDHVLVQKRVLKMAVITFREALGQAMAEEMENEDTMDGEMDAAPKRLKIKTKDKDQNELDEAKAATAFTQELN